MNTSEKDQLIPHSVNADTEPAMIPVKTVIKFVTNCVVAILAVIIIVLSLVLAAGVIFVIVWFSLPRQDLKQEVCENTCRYDIVESIPTNISLKPWGSISTFDSYLMVIKGAKKKLLFAEFYWDLTNNAKPAAHGEFGNETVAAILDAHDRGIYVEVLYSKPAAGFPATEIPIFKKHNIPVFEFDFEAIFGGVFHTKFMIADDNMFYLGSANMDWKSFTQVKELGLLVRDCKCLTDDLLNLYNNYKHFQQTNKTDNKFDTAVNLENPIPVPFIGDRNGTWFLGSSPAQVNTAHRTDDIVALLEIIKRAEEYVYIEVMKFLPCQFYTDPKLYWGELDTALKDALLRGVQIKLIIADWNHTLPIQVDYCFSLYYAHRMCLSEKKFWCHGTLEQKLMKIPDDPNFMPQYGFTRVNHAKFVVTEKDYAILNSNFAQDYYYSTSGITVYGTHKGIRDQLQTIFWRDWDSKYSKSILDYVNKTCTGDECKKFEETMAENGLG